MFPRIVSLVKYVELRNNNLNEHISQHQQTHVPKRDRPTTKSYSIGFHLQYLISRGPRWMCLFHILTYNYYFETYSVADN